ncbi:SAM-dependent methyltransferase [Pelagibacterales bacterium SAG-MED05]|nr:SAM-dependent methyltransferase [Pelagibacterales bacterium SAG-MED05]
MISNKNFFNNSKVLPVDQFIENVLYKKKVGYYSSKIPFGKKGDFLTAPGISNLFSEIIGIWLISTWNTLGRPKRFNIVELGPGDGSLTKILLKTFQQFSTFNQAANIFLYEKSNLLKKLQKKNINNLKVKWIKNFTSIKKGPIIFFGNEFFDAIPIKQFTRKKNLLLEKYYSLNKKNKIDEIYKKASNRYISQIKKFKILKNLKFVEFPKLGLDELNKIVKKIAKLEGGLLLIDYGYLTPKNKNTLQSLIKHKKNKLLDNLGKADITSLVNFNLLNEYFINNNLKVKKVVTQKFFLEKMGIIERANSLSKKMSFKEQSNLYLRLKRLLDTKLMGDLFKVIFTYKFKKDDFIGFE